MAGRGGANPADGHAGMRSHGVDARQHARQRDDEIALGKARTGGGDLLQHVFEIEFVARWHRLVHALDGGRLEAGLPVRRVLN